MSRGTGRFDLAAPLHADGFELYPSYARRYQHRTAIRKTVTRGFWERLQLDCISQMEGAIAIADQGNS